MVNQVMSLGGFPYAVGMEVSPVRSRLALNEMPTKLQNRPRNEKASFAYRHRHVVPRSGCFHG